MRTVPQAADWFEYCPPFAQSILRHRGRSSFGCVGSSVNHHSSTEIICSDLPTMLITGKRTKITTPNRSSAHLLLACYAADSCPFVTATCMHMFRNYTRKVSKGPHNLAVQVPRASHHSPFSHKSCLDLPRRRIFRG